ncbi:MAG: hypothetical protein ACT4OY_07580 [Alphaproteobacteria bacterium]
MSEHSFFRELACTVTCGLVACDEKKEEPEVPPVPEIYKHEFKELKNPTQDEIDEFYKTLPEIRSKYSNPVDFYNDAKDYFNCYGYASGSLGSGFTKWRDGKQYLTQAIPGALAGKPMQIFTADELHKATVADGFESVDPQEYKDGASSLQKPGYTLVAAFIESKDHEYTSPSFHFAIRGKDEKWTHKNGSSEIYTKRFSDGVSSLREPHMHQEDYLGDRYEFVGYYWRPDAGINVIAGDSPVSAFTHDGKRVESGMYDPATMRNDVWIATRGDYIATSFEVKKASLKALEDGNYSLILVDTFNKKVNLTLSPTMVFDEYDEKSPVPGATTGSKKIDFDDPSGSDLTLILRPDGSAKLIAREAYVPNRGPGNPFKQ